jgi:hypothetical protein
MYEVVYIYIKFYLKHRVKNCAEIRQCRINIADENVNLA